MDYIIFKKIFTPSVCIKNLAQHIYIPLDIFHAIMHNKPIKTPLEAWLTALTTCDLAHSEDLMPEELITMYSDALLVADRNMERMMIDEWRKELEDLKQEKVRLMQEIAQLMQENAQSLQENAQLMLERAQLLQENAQLMLEKAQLTQDRPTPQEIYENKASKIRKLLAEIELEKKK